MRKYKHCRLITFLINILIFLIKQLIKRQDGFTTDILKMTIHHLRVECKMLIKK